MSVIISWFVLLYFAILFAERLQSLIRLSADGSVGFFRSPFDIFVNILTAASLAATVVLLVGFNGGFWRSLFDSAVVPDYSMLTITAGVILAAGMMHTEFTAAPVQFASYGMLIVAMVLRTVQTAAESPSLPCLWYSLAYLTVFSMAIPVMYPSKIDNAVLFHVLEAVTALVLVFFFTYMLRLVFIGQGTDLLFWIPVVIMAVADAVLIAMRWKETVNSFVLIFAALSVVMFAVGKILFAVWKK